MNGRYYYEYVGSRHCCEAAYHHMGNAFYTLIMAAMREADTDNLEKLRQAFPDVHAELVARYNAPGGKLEGEE